jgi:UDP-GlcNAc:undecaprenyl-phosphate GlcNAc-1-phosphate transferase
LNFLVSLHSSGVKLSITIHEELFLYLIVSMVLSLAISPLSVFLAKRMNLIDIPRSTAHKQHAEVTPVVGGTILILVLAIMVSAAGSWKEEMIRVILFGAVIIYFFGLGDDVYGFSAPQKLIGQLLAAALLISNGLSVKFFHSFGEIFLPDKIILWMDIGLTILWLVGITNAMNLIDSMDGLVVGLTIITSLFFLFALLESGQPELVWLSVVVLGICLPLKLFNASPPKLFLGDSGAQTLGFLVAAMGMVYTPPGPQSVVNLVCTYPAVDRANF